MIDTLKGIKVPDQPPWNELKILLGKETKSDLAIQHKNKYKLFGNDKDGGYGHLDGSYILICEEIIESVVLSRDFKNPGPYGLKMLMSVNRVVKLLKEPTSKDTKMIKNNKITYLSYKEKNMHLTFENNKLTILWFNYKR